MIDRIFGDDWEKGFSIGGVYRTTTTETLEVITGMPSLDLMVEQ